MTFVRSLKKNYVSFLCSFVLILALPVLCHADIYVTILAVNGTEDEKPKEIKHYLPPELAAEDIIDTAGLKLDYDVVKGAYYVSGEITLKAKETRTYKVLIRDVWQLNKESIKKIKSQIGQNFDRVSDTEYSDYAQTKKDTLLQRLDYVLKQEEENAGNIEQRISQYRTYASEIEEIKGNSVSINYWKSKPPTAEDGQVYTYIINVPNPSKTEDKTVKPKQYLPREVKPDNIIDSQGFQFSFDAQKGQPYLTKEEALKAGEEKKYAVTILDVWNINQSDIDNVRAKTEKIEKLLQNSEYFEGAEFLIFGIKENLKDIEVSQEVDRPIAEHISAYRTNFIKYEKALKDLDTLEEILEAVREDLERSKLKNVLKKLGSLRNIAEIAKSLFKKPDESTAWKIITGVVIFVALFTIINFILWAGRSKDVKLKEKEEEEAKEVDEEEEE